jgi:uncharacterized protein YggU (UPF0235/DUF167 family)
MHISVRAQAGARKEKVTEAKNGRLMIAVKESAERNRANHRVRVLVAEHFKVPLAKTRLVSGHTSPAKIFDVVTGDAGEK